MAAVIAIEALVSAISLGVGVRDRQAHNEEIALETARKLALAEEGIRQALDRGAKNREELNAILTSPGGVQSLINQPARWELFIKSAQNELWQARQIAQSTDGTLDDTWIEAMDRFKAQLNGNQADYELALRLEKIRRDTAQRKSYDAYPLNPRVFAEYDNAFENFSANEEVATFVDRMRTSPIKEQLVAALDDWARVAFTLNAKDLAEGILTMTRQVAPDPAWGDRLRRVEVWLDQESLAKLVAEAPAAGLSPQLQTLVGSVVQDARLRESWLRKAQAEHPYDYWLNHDLAVALQDTNPTEAVGFLRAAIAIRPRDGAAYNELGYCSLVQNKLDEAIAAYRKATENDPEHSWARHNLANILQAHNKLDEAIAAYRKALEVDPDFAGAHLRLGHALVKQQKLDEAVSCYRKVIEIEPQNADAYHGLGSSLVKLQKPDEAIAACEEAIRLLPDDTTMQFVLASALAQSEQWDRSATVYAEVLKRNGPPLWPGPWYEAIRSEELFNRLTALRPDDSLPWIMRARLSVLERNWERAAADYSQVKGSLASGDGAFEFAASRLLVDDRPGYEQFCKQWADRVSRAKGLAKGLDYSLARSLAIDPGSLVPSGQIVEWARTAVQPARAPWHLHVLSFAHYRNGEFDSAIARALESNRGDWRGSAKALNWLILAMAHHRLGHDAEARKSLEQAFQLAARSNLEPPAGVQWPDMAPPDVLEFELLRREAENLIDPKPKEKPDEK
jgi:tetratricopeptide (TPR) repeat protein